MMGGGFFWYPIAVILTAIPLWKLLPTYGLSKLWALTVVLPVFIIILLWVMAFRDDIDGEAR